MALDFSQVKSIKISQFNQVEYLHFNGVDNYIDTGISFGQYINKNVEFEFSVDSFSRGAHLLSADLAIYVDTAGVLKASDGGQICSIGTITINTKYKLVISHRPGSFTSFTLYQGETSIGSSAIDSVTSTSMYLFARSYPGAEVPVRGFSAGKIYSFNSYVPYKNTSTGEIGLYSSSSSYKIMAGTINNDSTGVIVPPTIEFSGDLVKKIEDSNGNIIWGSQSAFPYRRLEYIHFDGVDEYFDIGYQPNNKTEFDMNVKFLTPAITAYNGKGYMGVRNRYAIGTNLDSTFFFGLGNWVTTTVSVNSSKFYSLKIRPNGFSTNVGYKIDNAAWVNPGNVSMVNGGTGNVFIGASNSSGGASNFIKQDVKSVVLIENTTTVRNMIPCQRKSDSICGMYDTINNVFYPLTGTTITSGAAGPTVDEY